MTLYINHRSGAKIFQTTNKGSNHSNQEHFRENLFETVIMEQQQLNKRLAKATYETAERSELHNEALLLQLNFQEKMLQEMNRKLLEYEQTSISLLDQLKGQEKINEVIEQGYDLQTVYHQTMMDRLNIQEKEIKDQIDKQGAMIINHVDDHKTIVANTVEQQEKQFIDLLIEQDTQLVNRIHSQGAGFEEHFDKQHKELKEFFQVQDATLKHWLDHHDATNEKIDRKLDFIKSTIFERAADLSEKIDGHVKRLSNLFASLFPKPGTTKQFLISDQEKKTDQEDIKMQ